MRWTTTGGRRDPIGQSILIVLARSLFIDGHRIHIMVHFKRVHREGALPFACLNYVLISLPGGGHHGRR